MTLFRTLAARSRLLTRKLTAARAGSRGAIPHHDGTVRRSMLHQATTRPVWLKFSQSAPQASTMPSAMAMLISVEMIVARKAGVALTIQQLREAAVYTVTYDEQSDRYLHEVFAPFGITYQPVSGSPGR
ncbi:hypothetical protein [Streptomyces sp. SID13031]|uniref:hypothetical protein n=1 Tax=Streptomyces sp. SID13031 TaxID=2706046 RepID=UPI0013C7915B|nr:hypothetical protein [Streptomyces sp. SID13031]NEA30568.1 hypothetical protein [Streptomyces sp. SID13031]